MFFLHFLVVFWSVLFSRELGFWYRNPHPGTLSFLIFFRVLAGGSPTLISGPLSTTFPTLAETSSYPTSYRKKSFPSKESDTKDLKEYVFRLRSRHHQLLFK